MSEKITPDHDAFARELLQSARLLDVPSDQGRQRARALLGAGAAVAGATVVGGLAHKPAVLMAWKTWILATIGIGAIAGGAVYAARLRHSAAPLASSAVSPTSAAPVVAPVPDPIPQATSEAPAVVQAEEVAAPSTAPSSTPRAASPAASSGSLADQIATLDRARARLDSGRPVEALTVLAEFDRRFPNGALSQEATVTRVEALFRAGHPSEATALANRFLAVHPDSSHAEHLRKLLRETASPTGD